MHYAKQHFQPQVLKHEDVLVSEAWLDNVKTHKGESATQAVTEYLKQVKA